jgi:hypothetical protein
MFLFFEINILKFQDFQNLKSLKKMLFNEKQKSLFTFFFVK